MGVVVAAERVERLIDMIRGFESGLIIGEAFTGSGDTPLKDDWEFEETGKVREGLKML